MRFLDLLAETDLPFPLPGRVASLLSKPRRFPLKDGRSVVLTVTPWSIDGDGKTIGLEVEALVDGIFAGSMALAPNRVPPAEYEDCDIYAQDRGSWSVNDLWVNQDYRRLGIAMAMYDMLARAGMKILASGQGYGGKLLPNGAALWASNKPPLRPGKQPKYQRFWKPKRR